MRILRWLLRVALVLPLQADATLVSLDLRSPGDGLITYDTETRLEWLDLSEMLKWFLGDPHPRVVLFPDFRSPTYEEVCDLFEGSGGAIFGCGGTAADFGSYERIAEVTRLLGVTDNSHADIQSSFAVFGTGQVQWAVARQSPFAAALGINRPYEELPYRYPSDPRYVDLLVRVPEPTITALLACLALAAGMRRAVR